MGFPKTTLNPSQRPGNLTGANGANVSEQLLENARAEADTVLKVLGSQLSGLSDAEADSRLLRYGPNDIARERRQSPLRRLLDNVKNPLVLLLVALGVLSYRDVVVFVPSFAGRAPHRLVHRAGAVGLSGRLCSTHAAALLAQPSQPGHAGRHGGRRRGHTPPTALLIPGRAAGLRGAASGLLAGYRRARRRLHGLCRAGQALVLPPLWDVRHERISPPG
jgi:hypothetical protein